MFDWPPPTCAQILRDQISAMSCKSRIIIVSISSCPTKAFCDNPTILDVNMMATAGMERTEWQWHDIIEGVGLKILNIRGPEPGWLETDSFIERGLTDTFRTFAWGHVQQMYLVLALLCAYV
jgi:hypothetical protein